MHVWIRGGDGRRWWVARRWLPWRPSTTLFKPVRLWQRPTKAILFLAVLDILTDLMVTLLELIINFLIFLFATVVFVSESLAVLVALPVVAVLRLYGRRPWTVSARSWDGWHAGEVVASQVKGWNASGELRRSAAVEIRERGFPWSLRRQQRSPDHLPR